jgi:hypothetical protein
MSDKEKLIELCVSLGLSESIINPARYDLIEDNCFAIDGNHIVVGSGSGYTGFYAIFSFDDNDKIIEHALME